MKVPMEVIVHAVKASSGNYEGTAFDSTTFHCEVDLKENGSGPSIGVVTRPFKCGKSDEFQKWAHMGKSLPCKAIAEMELSAGADNATKLVMVSIRPAAPIAKAA